jgi:hypothetical protein
MLKRNDKKMPSIIFPGLSRAVVVPVPNDSSEKE